MRCPRVCCCSQRARSRRALVCSPPINRPVRLCPALRPNPPALPTNPSYQEFYKVQQLVGEINVDLERCNIRGVPEDYFKEARILGMMRGVLTVWATDNPDTSYRQGMHEVLGVVIVALLAVEQLALEVASGGGGGGGGPDVACVRALVDIAQVEADAHWIFSYIMNDLQKLCVCFLLPLPLCSFFVFVSVVCCVRNSERPSAAFLFGCPNVRLGHQQQ